MKFPHLLQLRLGGPDIEKVTWGSLMNQKEWKSRPFHYESLIEKAHLYLIKQGASGPPLDFTELIDEISIILSGAAGAGAQDASASIGATLGATPESSLLFAQERAAEMVGMRLLESGELVVNPDARFAITDQMRSDVNSRVVMAVDQGWSPGRLRAELTESLGFNRAAMVARTETANSYGSGAADFYEESGQQHVEILDGKGCLPQGHINGAPHPDGIVGVVQSGFEADGQIWTVEQYRANLTGHPNCVRGTVAYIPREE